MKTIDQEHFLLVRNDRLGDALLALPVVTSLKRYKPSAKISFLASHYTAPLLRTVEGIDSVIEGDDRNAGITLRQLRRASITTAICLRPTFSNALALWRASIPVRIGTLYRAFSPLFTTRIPRHRRNSYMHETDLNLELLKGICPIEYHGLPAFNLPASAIESAEERLPSNRLADVRGVVALHPGSGHSAREWPPSMYAELAELLRSNSWRIIVTGSANERELCQSIVKKAGVNLAGKTDLVVLAAILRKVDLVIAGSTGPLHLANALGTKVLGLYPPVTGLSPLRWGPYRHPESSLTPDLPNCGRCRSGEISSCWCMEQLTPEKVYNYAVRLLSRQMDAYRD